MGPSGENVQRSFHGGGKTQAGFQRGMEYRWSGVNERHQRQGKGKIKGIILSAKEYGLFRGQGTLHSVGAWLVCPEDKLGSEGALGARARWVHSLHT